MKEIPLQGSDLEKIFNNNIAEYGFKDETNNNRTEIEKGSEETYRTNVRRQRDKILYTGGFRRLQDKTQVMPATISGDHRTRLTHTLEVEQIAVSIANALKLNADLVSAIALGHDVGHTPFGHAAERRLCKLLDENGGFHHPIQSVRYIWEKYGSKIEPVIYEGILLHDSDMFEIEKGVAIDQLSYLNEVKDEKNNFEDWVKIGNWLNEFPSTLEAQVVIWSDKIAYITHDLEDFLRSSAYINLNKNNEDIEPELCNILNELIRNEDEKKKIKILKDFELRDLIRNIINALIDSSARNINIEGNSFKQENVKEITSERSSKLNEVNNKKKYLNSLIINFDDKYREAYYKLRAFLDNYYIFSPEVQKSDAKAQVIVEWLFNTLNDNYKLMPLNIRREIDNIIIREVQKDASLKSISDNSENGIKNIDSLEKKIDEYQGENKEELRDRYNEKIKAKVISRKVAAYIATMSDTYAEYMYRNLIGSKDDFIL